MKIHTSQVDFLNSEIKRLHQFELAFTKYLEKTEWVQETAKPHELGMDRADVLKQRIDRLHEVNQMLLHALVNARDAVQHWGSYAQIQADVSSDLLMIDAAIEKAGEA